MPVAPEEDETEQPDDASHPHESNATVDRIQELQTTSEEILGEEVIPMLKECMKKVDGFNDRRNGALIHLKDDLQAQASQMEEWHKTVLDGICLQTKTLQKSMHERTSKITSRIFSLESFCRDLQNRKDADQQMRMIANLQAEQAKLRNDIKTLLKAMVTHVNKDDDDDSSSGESSSSSSSSSSGWSSHSDGSIPSDVTIYPPREPKAMPAKNTERKPAKTATKTGAKQASKTAKKTEGKPSAKPAPKPAKASSARKLAMPEDSERSLCSTVDSLILYGFHDETDGEAADAVAKMMDAAKAKAAAKTRKGAAKFTGKSRNFKTIDKKTLEDFRSAIRRESQRARSTRFATTRVVPQKTVKGAWGTE
ncbi:expressed unknown protein [Seminavis robusta]|uniref:Uncharacterized protein n=1 Tax=Seminavis robusta TaxID=568900 RepID=A0A9N8F3Z1_9STRA|nr:expressed unknown protein [Seminavis robusta]|eukprot:Sro3409_g347710.1 n/a (366) ;mRNA; r:56-1153